MSGNMCTDGYITAKSAKQRKKAAKALRAREAALANSTAEPRVPLEEQTIDLPSGGRGVEGNLQANVAREDVTKALRRKRRSTIKEANFLKSMA